MKLMLYITGFTAVFLTVQSITAIFEGPKYKPSPYVSTTTNSTQSNLVNQYQDPTLEYCPGYGIQYRDEPTGIYDKVNVKQYIEC